MISGIFLEQTLLLAAMPVVLVVFARVEAKGVDLLLRISRREIRLTSIFLPMSLVTSMEPPILLPMLMKAHRHR